MRSLNKIEDVALHRVGILGYFSVFCPKQDQGLKPPAAPLFVLVLLFTQFNYTDVQWNPALWTLVKVIP